jgi:CheY-like chemotaxis protein
MSAHVPVVPPPRTLSGPAALRTLAKAFAHIADFRPFVDMLEVSLGKAAFFERAEILLTEGEAPPPEGFVGGQFTLPITGTEALHGVLKVASPGRVFGPEDLHLMASLAGVLAAILDHAKRHGEVNRNLEVLNFLLNLAPVGMVALDGMGGVLAANDIARRWLGADSMGELAERLEPAAIGTDWRTARSFHFQAGGRLIYAEVRSHGHAQDGTQAYALVLADLGTEQARLTDGLQREWYRCRWLGRPLSFVLVESSKTAGGVLKSLPALREALQAGETAGAHDAFSLGIILPELDAAAVLARLRTLKPQWADDGLRFGVVLAGEADAAGMIAAAKEGLRSHEDVLRRTLLLHDDYPAVNDMIELVLGRRFHIVKSTRIAETQELLRTRPFDGIFTEVELRNGASGIELAKFAKRLQPGIRPYFTTVTHTERLQGLDPELSDHVVLRKPFDIALLDQAVRATLA